MLHVALIKIGDDTFSEFNGAMIIQTVRSDKGRAQRFERHHLLIGLDAAKFRGRRRWEQTTDFATALQLIRAPLAKTNASRHASDNQVTEKPNG